MGGWMDRKIKQVRLTCMNEAKLKRFMKINFSFLSKILAFWFPFLYNSKSQIFSFI